MDDQNERVAALEAGHKSLHKDVENIADAVARLGRDFRGAIDDVHRLISEQNKTPWALLFQGATVFLVIIGFVGSFYVRDLTKMADQTEAQGIAILIAEKELNAYKIETLERIHKLEIEAVRQNERDRSD